MKKQKLQNGGIMAIDFKNLKIEDITFENFKLFLDPITTAKSLMTTRHNNLIATNAFALYLADQKKTPPPPPCQGYGLTLNLQKPNETDEFYAALTFLSKNMEFCKNSKTMIKIMDMFSLSLEDYKNVILEGYIYKKQSKDAMSKVKDIDIRKIAACFAVNGDYRSKNATWIQDKNKLNQIDEKLAGLIVAWKKDIIDNANETNEYGDGEKN